VVEADTVIAAIGQKLDAPAVLDGTPVELNRWGYLAADPNTGQTSVEWVFAGGDASTGPSSVVEAIGAGERAAAGMDEHITGVNHAFWRRDIEPPTFFDPDADPELVDRHQVEELAVGARVTNFDEVELGWAAQDMLDRSLDGDLTPSAGVQTLVNEVVSALPDLVRSYSESTGPDVGRIRQLTSACFALAASGDGEQYGALPEITDVISATGPAAEKLPAAKTLAH